MVGFCFPFKGIALTIYTLINTSMQGFGLNINMFTYIFFCVLVNFVWLAILAIMIPTVFKCNVAPLKDLDIENVSAIQAIPQKFDKRQMVILAIFCLAFLYIIVVPLLPQGFPGSAVLSPIGATLIFFLALTLLGLIHLANPMKLLSDGTLWNVVCIVGCFTFLGKEGAKKRRGKICGVPGRGYSIFRSHNERGATALYAVAPPDYPLAKAGGAVNGGALAPLILTVDWLGWFCYSVASMLQLPLCLSASMRITTFPDMFTSEDEVAILSSSKITLPSASFISIEMLPLSVTTST